MVVGLLCILVAGLSSAGQLVVIELKHRPADDVIPIIAPLLGPSDTLSGHGYQLFLSTTPENRSRIRAIIAHLDQAVKQLAITVVHGEQALDKLNALAISGSVSIGDGVTVTAGDRQGQPADSLDIKVNRTQGSSRRDGVQRVLVQDGDTATIYVGLSAPAAVGSPRLHGMTHHQIVVYREMLTGVQVTPRLHGDHVTLEVLAQDQRPSGDHPAAVQTQRIQSRVRGQLNQWIDIGGILTETLDRQTGLVEGQIGQQTSRHHVFVRVEVVP